MFEIKIKVNGNGTLTFGNGERLNLGTTGESQRIKLVFDVDDTVEGSYQYIKFVNQKATYLYRIYSKSIVLSRNIQVFDGVWKFSFISTNAGIVNNQIIGSYAFITEPVEAIVVKGILSSSSTTEEETVLKTICAMNFTNLEIPDCVTLIGDYFMYNSKKSFALNIGKGVTSIGSYAFYDASITKLAFDEHSSLVSLNDYAFYHLSISGDVVLPASITSWGKYVFQNTSVNKISFAEGCSLATLGSYALWENGAKEIELPDGLTNLSGNTYVIKNCTSLKRLWIPKSIQTAIPSNAIYGCTSLETIELENDFNISASFINCTALTTSAIVNMLYALKNLNGTNAKSLTIGSTNLAKLTADQKAIATNKNWTLS